MDTVGVDINVQKTLWAQGYAEGFKFDKYGSAIDFHYLFGR
jgi:hypothetical protein